MNRARQPLKDIVDAHCHLWKLELARQGGLKPEFGPIFRTFEPTDLSEAARPCGVKFCVLVESGKTAEERRAMEQMAASSGLIAAMIHYVDLESPSLEKDLDSWQRNPKFRGVRARFEGHPDPDILARPNIVEGLRLVARRGLIFEFLIRASHLKDLVKLYARIPQLKGVIEHMAKPDMETSSDAAEWRLYLRALAEHSTVACKLSLSPRVEEMERLVASRTTGWRVQSITPFVQYVIEHFRPNRLMWGSDWPIALLVSSYAETLQAMRSAIGGLSQADERQIFRMTATRFYQLPG